MRLTRCLLIALGVLVIVGAFLTSWSGALIALSGAGIVALGWVPWRTRFQVVIRRPWLRTVDPLTVVAVAALVMAAAWPVLERRFLPRYSTTALVVIHSRPGNSGNPSHHPRIQDALDSALAYLKSPEALEDVERNPALAALPEPPAAEHLARTIRQRLRINVIPTSALAQFSLEGDDPATDAAIVNAAALSVLKHPGIRGNVVSLATPPQYGPLPRRRPSYYRGALGVAASLFALLFSVAMVLAVKVIRILRIPDEIAPTARQEFVETLSDILATPIQAPEPESTLNFADSPVLATFPAP